jgi:two-component system, LytTR family, sensor kinase
LPDKAILVISIKVLPPQIQGFTDDNVGLGDYLLLNLKNSFRFKQHNKAMTKSPLKKRISILIHILVWGLLGSILFLFGPLSWKVELPMEFWFMQLIRFSLLIIAFYLNLYYFIPNILFKNRTLMFLVITLLSGIGYLMLLYTYDEVMNMSMVMHKAFRPNIPYTPKPRNLTYDFYSLVTYYLVIGIGTSIGAVQRWQSEEEVRSAYEQQRINSELLYLKAQINPHFFFNTLNNIYSLINLDVEKAKTALLKLSRMMRYVLYETEKQHTFLTKEVDFIRDYIELMRLRLSGKVFLQIEIPEKVNEAEIAPMLLLPFIENCFKHGISSQQESSIAVLLKVQDNILTLETKNKIFKSVENTPEGNASGIGLSNTMRRLNLLYADKHKIEISQKEDLNEYHVFLTLNLK